MAITPIHTKTCQQEQCNETGWEHCHYCRKHFCEAHLQPLDSQPVLLGCETCIEEHKAYVHCASTDPRRACARLTFDPSVLVEGICYLCRRPAYAERRAA